MEGSEGDDLHSRGWRCPELRAGSEASLVSPPVRPGCDWSSLLCPHSSSACRPAWLPGWSMSYFANIPLQFSRSPPTTPTTTSISTATHHHHWYYLLTAGYISADLDHGARPRYQVSSCNPTCGIILSNIVNFLLHGQNCKQFR